MTRKEITDTIAQVGVGTFMMSGSMSLLNPKTGEAIEIDMPSTLAIVRGTLAWVDTLLEVSAVAEPNTTEHIRKLLTYVGCSLGYEIASDEER